MAKTAAVVGKDGPNKSVLRVNFMEKDDLTDRKKKYLTAKYGSHQMSLIKKRLRVEMWMYERLQVLYKSDDSEVEIDLDQLLDMEDPKRKEWLRGHLKEAKSTKDTVEEFIEELLEKAKTL